MNRRTCKTNQLFCETSFVDRYLYGLKCNSHQTTFQGLGNGGLRPGNEYMYMLQVLVLTVFSDGKGIAASGCRKKLSMFGCCSFQLHA